MKLSFAQRQNIIFVLFHLSIELLLLFDAQIKLIVDALAVLVKRIEFSCLLYISGLRLLQFLLDLLLVLLQLPILVLDRLVLFLQRLQLAGVLLHLPALLALRLNRLELDLEIVELGLGVSVLRVKIVVVLDSFLQLLVELLRPRHG